MNNRIRIGHSPSLFHRKTIIATLLFALILCSFITAFTPVSAASIKKKNVKLVGSFKSVRGGIQGGTITENYYVFADKDPGNWGKTNIRFFKRSNNKEAKADGNLTGQEFKHASSLYYKWGSGYIQIIDANTGKWWCANATTRKKVNNDKCGKRLGSSGLNHGSTQYWRQGWAKYGDYYFRAYAGNGNNVEVYNKKRKFVKNFSIPSSVMPGCEIEDVAVDGEAGDVYVMCHGKSHGHTADFYKIDKSVFKKYVKPASDNSSNSSNSNNSSTPTYHSNPTPTFTPAESKYDGSVETNFFGTVQEDGSGCGVFMILTQILDILTFGIAIAATIGITLSGIIYLGSNSNEQQVTKAKRRILEIVIGLVMYAALYALINFLLPGAHFNTKQTCVKTTNTSISQQKIA